MSDNIPSNTWNLIVAELNERLKAPSDELPNVQWLSEYFLRRLLLDVAKTAKAPPTLSGRTLLRMLVDSQLARQLPPDDFSDASKSPAIYSLELGGVPSISPIELLQATQSSYQNTAICYFTALERHELTTQEAPHHHVASLKAPSKQPRPKPVPSPSDADDSRRKPSLGTLLFRYQDIPYYMLYRRPSRSSRHSESCRSFSLSRTGLVTAFEIWSVWRRSWRRGRG